MLKRKKGHKYYRKMLDDFSGYMNSKFSMELLTFLRKRTIEELVILQLKCTQKMKAPERVLQTLTNEINRRIQNRFLIVFVIPIIISILALVISIFK